jgi:hypothetical protein
MTSLHPVEVFWSDEKRQSLPTSGQYVTAARFAEDGDAWGANAWSIVLQIRGDVSAQPCRADARFLSPEAPQDRFRPGVRFELLEGNQVTAIVEVIQ